jgi:hypothetical protein
LSAAGGLLAGLWEVLSVLWHFDWASVFREEHCRAHLRSEERSQDLLRQWLSPDQAEQYDLYQHFEVVGSDTGTRYRTGM